MASLQPRPEIPPPPQPRIHETRDEYGRRIQRWQDQHIDSYEHNDWKPNIHLDGSKLYSSNNTKKPSKLLINIKKVCTKIFQVLFCEEKK